MEDKKDIYQAKLHEAVKINHATQALRVPGGWIYWLVDEVQIDELHEEKSRIHHQSMAVFVPYNTEFKPNVGGKS